MDNYSTDGIVFFNEAHFQSTFTIDLNNEINSKDFQLILEYNPNYKKYRVDLFVINKTTNEKTVIEFKYITDKTTVEIDNSLIINLKAQRAYNVRRYQIWKDISKIEELIDSGKCDDGYFIMITNADKLIQTVPKNNIDKEFDISNGTHPSKTGELYWSYSSPKTEKRYPKKIPIRSQYKFNYFPYSGIKPFSEFKYLILSINV